MHCIGREKDDISQIPSVKYLSKKRKKVIQVWEGMRVSKMTEFPFLGKLSLQNGLIIVMTRITPVSKSSPVTVIRHSWLPW